MKNLILTALVAIIGLGTLVAEDNGTKWTPESFAVSAGVYTKTTNFEDDTGGVSVGLDAYWTDNIGLNLEARATDAHYRAIEETWINGLWRHPLNENAATVIYGGAGRAWEDNHYAIGAGVRLEHRIYGPLHGYVKAGWEKPLDRDLDHAAVGGAGVSLKF